MWYNYSKYTKGNKMKIVVLAGGLSPERDVSLTSGALIANALIENGNQVCLLDLYIGEDLSDRSIDDLFFTQDDGKKFEYSVPRQAPDLDQLKRDYGQGDKKIGPNVLKICMAADIVFMALHGDIGENGQLQATFDCFDIKYTGTGYGGSFLAMDKLIAKKLMNAAGIKNADWLYLRQGQALPEIEVPCVVKPLNCGSSIGVSIVQTPEELEQALDYAFRYAPDVLIEDYIPGRELQVGVLLGQALPVIEIIPEGGFYDYENKYQAGMAVEVCPAEIPEAKTRELQELARRVHEALNLGSYSRVDFIMTAAGEIYCLEANTLPGMTPTSLLPQEAAAVGISYNQLCQMIADSVG